jgi:hypothetical protein
MYFMLDIYERQELCLSIKLSHNEGQVHDLIIYIAACTPINSQTIDRQNRTLPLLKACTKP